MIGYQPTTEQLLAREAYSTGADLIIEAAAGAGKTSTLHLLAESNSASRCQYVAFNKAIVQEAQEKMPGNVRASTAHSLAFRALGHRYSHRLNARRMRSTELAQRLKVQPQSFDVLEHKRILSAAQLAGLVMRGITQFCQSADPEPRGWHVPYVEGLDQLNETGKRTFANNNALRRYLESFLVTAWRDLLDPQGQLPYKHEHYLKAWELSGPYIEADVILFDECQDVSPVLASIVAQQRSHAQRVYVGDSNQAIYGWLGAVDAIAQLKSEGTRVTTLTQSFRFGPAIAEVANRFLAKLPTEMRVVGTPSIASTVGPVAEPDAVLCRSNATAVQTLLLEAAAGRRAHLVGGGSDVSSFARGALELQELGRTDHQELACFNSWHEVQEYVRLDAQGDELKLLVQLVDRFTPQTIIEALDRMPREEGADVVVSTAHKAKGRQWKTVQLADDFLPENAQITEDELRLMYVAVTRARIELDVTKVTRLDEVLADEDPDEPEATSVLTCLSALMEVC